MGRRKINRMKVFQMFSLNYTKKKIKKEAGLSERTYFNIKQEYDALPEEVREKLRKEATKGEKARAEFTEYPYVQKWLALMKSERLKSWRRRLADCETIWLILQKKNPQNWSYDDIKLRVIPELRKGRKSIFHFLVSLRSLRPDFKHGFKAIKTKGEKAKPMIAWKVAYKALVRENRIDEYFEASGDPDSETLVRNHVEWGCREGFAGFRRW